MGNAMPAAVRHLLGCGALGCAAVLAAACGSPGSTATASGSAAATSAAASSPTGIAGSAPAAITATAAAPASATAAAPPQSAAGTFLAPGQDIRAAPLHEPACAAGCALSGDATAFLYRMTWRTWSAAAAVGAGTYRLDDCNPNCAAGTVYPVAAVVTLSQPVRACLPSGTRWFWSRASFAFPHGLPKALQGSNGPQNPWVFSSLIAAARQSCA
jgi:hypothetical protein